MTDKEKRIKELVVFAFKMINDYKKYDFLKLWVDMADKDDSCRESMIQYIAAEAIDFDELELIRVSEEQDPILKAIKMQEAVG